MTLVEAVVVIFVIAFLVLMILPALAPRHGGAQRINCTNNLKQLNLAYLIWAGDNNGKYPMQVPVTNGGAMELIGGPDGWKTFQVMSNELSTPKILWCPEDATRGGAATNFGDDLKNKISYFINQDATVANTNILLSGFGDDLKNKINYFISIANTNMLLSGDDHFLINGSPVRPGLIDVTSNTSIAWDFSRHVSSEPHAWLFKRKMGRGNIGLGDGSVQSVSNPSLTNWLQKTGLATNRLAIP